MVQFSERVAAFYIAALATVLSCAITAWSVWMHVDAGGRHAARRVRLAAGGGSGGGTSGAAPHDGDAGDADAEIRRDTIRILILGARRLLCLVCLSLSLASFVWKWWARPWHSLRWRSHIFFSGPCAPALFHPPPSTVPLYAVESFFDLFFKHYPGGSVFREAYESIVILSLYRLLVALLGGMDQVRDRGRLC